jgi:hypothetical protein
MSTLDFHRAKIRSDTDTAWQVSVSCNLLCDPTPPVFSYLALNSMNKHCILSLNKLSEKGQAGNMSINFHRTKTK